MLSTEVINNVHANRYTFGKHVGGTLGSGRRGGHNCWEWSFVRVVEVVGWVFCLPTRKKHVSSYGQTYPHTGIGTI